VPILPLAAVVISALLVWVMVLHLQLRSWAADAVTGLPVRRKLYRDAARALRRAQHPVVVFLDLDRFKSINDQYGHQVGDAVLGVLARRLRGAVWPPLLRAVGRLGGDEFVVVLDATDGEATAVLHSIAAVIAGEPISPQDLRHTTFPAAGAALRIGVSLGAVAVAQGTDLGAALALAEAQMRAAKRCGGGIRYLHDAHPAPPLHRPQRRARDQRASCVGRR
jgi:diguanylate cyclase (GGDEF)-like protein